MAPSAVVLYAMPVAAWGYCLDIKGDVAAIGGKHWMLAVF